MYFGGKYVSATTQVQRSEDNLQKSVLSFGHMTPGDRTWVQIGSKGVYSLSHLACPVLY